MTDDKLIEAMAQAMARDDDPFVIEMYRSFARDALAVARPIIEAQERERCARIADGCDKSMHPADVAAAIRGSETTSLQKMQESRETKERGMSDIVKRLRWVADLGIPDFTNAQILREAADEIERLRTELAVVVADRAAAISRAEALERDRDALDDTLCDIAYLLGCRANTTEPIEAVKSVIAKAAEIDRLREALAQEREKWAGESRDAWRHAASSSLGKHESARILRDRWRESAQQAFDVATSDPQTAEQWRAFGHYECGMAYADEIDPDVE